MAASGLREIEVGSFVPAHILPQLADTAEVVAHALTIPGLTVAVLVPNRHGAEAAIKAGAHKLTIPFSASETHSLKNVRRTQAQMLEEVRGIVALIRAQAADRRPKFEGGMSTAFGCTYEGAVPADKVVRLAEQLREAGCDEVGLSDSVGYANPAQIRDLVVRVRNADWPRSLRRTSSAQHARPGARERRRRTRSRRRHVRQLDGRHRRLSVRTGRDRQHRHRRPGVHARIDGPAHRRRSRRSSSTLARFSPRPYRPKSCTATCPRPACLSAIAHEQSGAR